MAGSCCARVIAMMCSAWLSCRSPPRLSRCWVRWPEEHGIGAVPGLQREARVRAESLGAGGVADQDRGGQRAATVLGKQLRAVCLDELGQLGLEPLDTAVEAAQIWRPARARPGPWRRLGELPQPPVDPVEHRGLVQRATLERAPRARGTARADASAAGSPCGCARRRDRCGDRRSSRISIACSSRYATGNFSTPSLTTARATASASISSDLPGSRSPLREAPIRCGATLTTRSPAASSACSSRRETRPAVLDRPHPLLIEARAPTAPRPDAPARSALISRLPRTRPVPSSTAASACEPLCVSAPITIICTVPSFG